ncbi:potassium channel family protein [Anaeromicrobium sediminis]|nr:potassium channel family protein [Anaeromicrobium sediminis]
MELSIEEYRLTKNLSYRILEKNNEIVKIEFRKNSEVTEIKEYKYINTYEIYRKIYSEEKVDLSNCYVEDFSLSKYRKYIGADRVDEVYIKEFMAKETFFVSDEYIDFSIVKFEQKRVVFRDSIFAKGKVNFDKANFGEGNVCFNNVNFGKGSVDFKEVNFGEGNVCFDKANFGEGQVRFDKANFGDGNVSFRMAKFGKEYVDFMSSNFGKGNVYFGLAKFGEETVNFRNVNFGEGNVYFDNVNFGKGNVDFCVSKFGKGDADFSNVNFGEGNVDFKKVNFGEGNVNFNNVNFGDGNIYFNKAKLEKGEIDFQNASFGKNNIFFHDVRFGEGNIRFNNSDLSTANIEFSDCKFENDVDFRFKSCKSLNLKDITNKQTMNFRFENNKPLKWFKFKNLINYGRIEIDLKQSNFKNLINKQNSTYKEKADQFLILKENFNNLGQYDDEDEAYVEFKRCERRSRYTTFTRKLNPLYWVEVMLFDWVGAYGTKPYNVLCTMLLTIIGFATSYLYIPTMCINFDNSKITNEIVKAIYYSGITFLTIGYGDISPQNEITAMTSVIEGFLGIFLMSYFTVSFVRKLLR